MKTWCVYRINDAKGHTRYVGCTQNVWRRWNAHISCANELLAGKQKSYLPVTRWLARELYACATPIVVPIASCWTKRDAMRLEQQEIRRLLAAGARLLNDFHAGGRGQRAAVAMKIRALPIEKRRRQWWLRLGEVTGSPSFPVHLSRNPGGTARAMLGSMSAVLKHGPKGRGAK